MTTDINSISAQTGISVEQLQQLIDSGVSIEQLKPSEFPEFINGKQYLFEVTEAKLSTVSKGANQGQERIEVTAFAVDGDGVSNDRARAKMWLALPFDTTEYQWPTAERRGYAQQDLTAIIEGTGNPAYQTYAKKVAGVGGKNHYFDADGNELVGKQISDARAKAQVQKVIGMSGLKSDPTALVGAKFYATWEVKADANDSAKIWKNFRFFTQKAGPNLVTEANKMMARPGSAE